jgi:ATP-dependent DNA helicase RecQ
VGDGTVTPGRHHRSVSDRSPTSTTPPQPGDQLSAPPDLAARAAELLRDLAGPDAVLRDDQLAAISALVDGRQRVLVVQRTGWGKSAVYWIATRLRRDAGAGPTLVVSPLLALMRDQVEAAARMGVKAATINSTNVDDWTAIEADLAAGDIDVLLISPERLNSAGFRAKVLQPLSDRIGLLVIDEAHCISDWGHDFRPDYRRLGEIVGRLGADIPVLATTATANARVAADIAAQLGGPNGIVPTVTLRGELGRDSLALSVVALDSAAERLAFVAARVAAAPGSGIIYCLTVAETETVAAHLEREGLSVASYSGSTNVDVRTRVEADLKANRVKAVVATSALGMGFDKADLAFVIHLGSPSSPIAYYQQVGRAGRAIASATATLLPSPADRRIWSFFDAVAFPSEEATRAVLEHLIAHGPVSVPGLEGAANLSRSRLEAMLKILDVEGAVERSGGGWVRTGAPWTYDRVRVAKVRAIRAAEAESMLDYAATDGCRMQFLRDALDDPASAPCGRCDNCAGTTPVVLDPEAVGRALAHLRSTETVLEPRKLWPSGIGVRRGRITKGAEPGRALAFANDPGWFEAVSAALTAAERPGGRAGGDPVVVDAELVDGCVAALRRWTWAARPTWVTWIPSVRRPGLAEAVATTLAHLGQLALLPTLARVAVRPAQDTMANSSRSALNALGAFDVIAAQRDWPSGPVLVVDDTVRSGWTMTVVAELLLSAGTGPVLPFALWKRP